MRTTTRSNAFIVPLILAGAVFAGSDHPDYETRAVKVRVGSTEKVVALADLEALPAVTLENYQPVGASRGTLAKNTWTGASLRAVLLAVDPGFCDGVGTRPPVSVRSQDGWTVTLKRAEICGTAAGGEALYAVKGCNECHGASGEGSAPPGKPPAPALRGRGLTVREVTPLLRQGGKRHTKADVYDEPRLKDSDVEEILAWLDGSTAAASRYVVPPERRSILLAFRKNGQPMSGRDGLIQLVVAMDEYAGRYSHWVSEIETEPRGDRSAPVE